MKYQLCTNPSKNDDYDLSYPNDLELSWCFYDPSRILQLFKFVRTPCSSVWVGFNNFFIDATDKARLAAITIEYFLMWAYIPPFILSEHSL